MSQLLKDPEKGLRELRRFQIELQQLQTRYFFGEMHSADEDFETGVMRPLYDAEKASSKLESKLTELVNKKLLSHA